MIPHISFTEIVEASLALMAVGYIAGAWTMYRLTRK
jgi:hypothetical protein